MRSRQKIPLSTRRSSTRSLPRTSVGNRGSITPHSASVRSNRAIQVPPAQRAKNGAAQPCQPLWVRDLVQLRDELTLQLAGARERRRQDRWLAGAVGLGLVFGVMATLVLPRLLLPGWLGLSVAATVLGADRWNAGAALMQSGSPQGWRALVDASRLVRANEEAVRGCTEAAAKAKKEQRCTITVAPPP